MSALLAGLTLAVLLAVAGAIGAFVAAGAGAVLAFGWLVDMLSEPRR